MGPPTGEVAGEPMIDTTVAHEARVYDYLLGGETNFEADRVAAERAGAAVGGIDVARASVRSNRAFLAQAARYLASEAGILQFLDIGTGLPNVGNVHTVVQEVAPDARVVYVDNDPIVLAHAHLLLSDTEAGATSYVQGDLRDPDGIVAGAAATLDFDAPIAVILNAILHHIPDGDEPYRHVARLMEAVPAGSYLAISHLTDDMQSEEMAALARSVPAQARYRFRSRTHAELSRFFEGLEMVEPGLVRIDEWRPDDPDGPVEGRYHYGGIGKKP
jgi:trans-aconitate methyltransferase